MSPDQFEYDQILNGIAEPEMSAESTAAKRHVARVTNLTQYKQVVKKQNRNQAKKASEEIAKTQSSKHIEKYRHKQIHMEDFTKDQINE